MFIVEKEVAAFEPNQDATPSMQLANQLLVGLDCDDIRAEFNHLLNGHLLYLCQVLLFEIINMHYYHLAQDASQMEVALLEPKRRLLHLLHCHSHVLASKWRHTG